MEAVWDTGSGTSRVEVGVRISSTFSANETASNDSDVPTSTLTETCFNLGRYSARYMEYGGKISDDDRSPMRAVNQEMVMLN